MSKTVMFVNENGNLARRYLAISEQLEALEKEHKDIKTKLDELFTSSATDYKTQGKSEYKRGDIRCNNERITIVHRVTYADGSVDWAKWAKAHGYDTSDIDMYRRPKTRRVHIDRATETQLKELELMQYNS